MPFYPSDMFFTSESVTEGHPDKLCDQISDTVLDECLKTDPESRVACNTFVTMGLILIGGQITITALFDVEQVVRQLGNDIGYTSPKFGFDIHGDDPEIVSPPVGRHQFGRDKNRRRNRSRRSGHDVWICLSPDG